MSKLKAGVVGAGVFGQYHANKYFDNPDVELCGIFDTNLDTSKELANRFNCSAYDTYDNILEAVDIVTIAVPAAYHYEFALKALKARKHAFVEKPIAATLNDANALETAANSSGLVLAVGHQERAVGQVLGLFDVDEQPLTIEAVRNGPWSLRGTDVSVTLDLMTHDLDLVGTISSYPAGVKVKAAGVIERSENLDEISAELDLPNGMKALLSSSRLKSERERWMKITYPSGEFYIDFITREIRNTSKHIFDIDFLNHPHVKDSLGYNLNCFVDAVLGKTSRPLVTAQEAVWAVSRAEEIDKACSGSA